MWVYDKILIRRILGRQYSSKANLDKEVVRRQLEAVLPKDFVVMENIHTGFLYVTRKD